MINRSQLFVAVGAAMLLSGCSTVFDTVTNFAPDGSVGTEKLYDLRQNVQFDAADELTFDEALVRFAPVLSAYRGTIPVRMTVVSNKELTSSQKTTVLSAAKHIRLEALRISFESAGLFSHNKFVTVRFAPDKPDVYRSWYESQYADSDFGSSIATGLAQQADNPRDLMQPRQLDAPNPQAAVGAVERYQKGQVRPLAETSLEAGGSTSN